MRRKKIFISLVILLVLGLGVVAEYQRRTRDIEIEIPVELSGSYAFVHDSYAISSPFFVYQSGEQLVVYDMEKNTRTKISSELILSKVVMDYPWVVWEEAGSNQYTLVGYDLRQLQAFPICDQASPRRFPVVSGNIAVWGDGQDIFGFDLERKTQFPVCVNANWKCDPDIDGDTIVWIQTTNGASGFSILCHDLKSGKQRTIHSMSSFDGGPKVSVPYVVWKELDPGDPNEFLVIILAYDLRNGETITVCSGLDGDSEMDIRENIVVWDDRKDGFFSDIYGYNLKTRQQFSICTADEDQNTPKITGNTIVWRDHRRQGWLSRILKKEPCDIRGKTFRHWPGEEGK